MYQLNCGPLRVCSGFVEGLGFRVSGLGFRVQLDTFRTLTLELRYFSSWFLATYGRQQLFRLCREAERGDEAGIRALLMEGTPVGTS